MVLTVYSISSGERAAGASEKFHGAVVDHYGKEDTRVFREVAKLGENLEKMDKIRRHLSGNGSSSYL